MSKPKTPAKALELKPKVQGWDKKSPEARKKEIEQARHRKSRRLRLESLTIVDKEGVEGTLGEFGLTDAQLRANALRDHMLNEWKVPCRILQLKWRQHGGSTDEQANNYDEVIQRGYRAAVIAHDKESAVHLLGMFKTFQQYDTTNPSNLATGHGGSGTLTFKNRKGRVDVGTAGSPNALRSRTLQRIHGSECAFWGEGGGLLHRAITKAVPRFLKTSSIHYETTANGQDPIFYNLWQNAARYCKLSFIPVAVSPKYPFGYRVERTVTDPKGRWNRYYPFFVSALEDERNRMLVDKVKIEIIRDSMTEEEKWLMDDLGAPWEFLEWRRFVLASECRNDIQDLHQEFPVTPQQAFIASGSPRFNHDILNRMPLEGGRVGYLARENRWGSGLHFVDEPFSELTLFRMPQPGHRYVVAVDTSLGIESFSGDCEHCGGRTDESAVMVLDIDCHGKAEEVAVLAGRIREEDLAEPVLALAEWYNMAFIVPETTLGHGFVLAEKLAARYPRDRLYRVREGGRPSNRPDVGLMISPAKRNKYITELATVLHAEELILHSAKTVHQMKAIRRGDYTRFGYRYEAERLHHDDVVFAMIGAIMGRKHYPPHCLPSTVGDRLQTASLSEHLDSQVGICPDPEGFY